ncbi:hypothetical protein AVEN_41873-1 [Araneus ventricosus]|uniref:Uncharacterized protein n=1 Tax=Araneus ventricosus TaxID=182803 RepID=A0A4Y2ADV6_ARAVE|nr:hypothetical protein AVEN_41873-1 [Araneus ventricosus]
MRALFPSQKSSGSGKTKTKASSSGRAKTSDFVPRQNSSLVLRVENILLQQKRERGGKGREEKRARNSSFLSLVRDTPSGPRRTAQAQSQETVSRGYWLFWNVSGET